MEVERESEKERISSNKLERNRFWETRERKNSDTIESERIWDYDKLEKERKKRKKRKIHVG
jgi:hypothetical protein